MAHRLKPTQLKMIRKLAYAETVRGIARIIGCSRTCIQKHLDDFGIESMVHEKRHGREGGVDFVTRQKIMSEYKRELNSTKLTPEQLEEFEIRCCG